MPFCFRYRIRMSKPLSIGAPVLLRVPDLPFEIAPLGDSVNSGNWFAIKACGFDTEAAAKAAGERFGRMLLLAGAIEDIGLDLGYGKSDVTYHQGYKDLVSNTLGRELLADPHGMMVFEQDTVVTQWQQVQAWGAVSIEGFEDRLTRSALYGDLSEAQTVCALLLNDSFFAESAEAQFILRVSAMEALCPQAEVLPEHSEVLETLVDFVSLLEIAQEVKAVITQWLGEEKRVGVSSAMRTKFAAMLPDQWGSFKRLRDARSRLLHEGIGRGRLGQEAADSLTMAIALLKADLAGPRLRAGQEMGGV